MNARMNRRAFTKSVAAGMAAAAAPALHAAKTRKLKIGYTCITWGAFPRGPEASATLEAAVKDISSLGFDAFETFPQILEDWDTKGALSPLIDRYNLPVRSGYITANLTDPAQRKEQLERVIKLSKVIKKYGGTFAVLAPNSVKRAEYDFNASRANIIAALNDYAMAITDLGLGTGLHQHTGTAIDSQEEVYAVMESVNTKYLKFAPDVGQLQKGGADAAKVVKDFLPLLRHMHLKDWKGWEHHAGYCPLGQGKVDLAAILEMAESVKEKVNIMVELDPSKDQPLTPLECAQVSKDYSVKQGYKFRT